AGDLLDRPEVVEASRLGLHGEVAQQRQVDTTISRALRQRDAELEARPGEHGSTIASFPCGLTLPGAAPGRPRRALSVPSGPSPAAETRPRLAPIPASCQEASLLALLVAC